MLDLDKAQVLIALTDDEVLALAARSDCRWPSIVPTVDVADEASLAEAVTRGARSLMVRNLLGVDGHDALADSVQAIIGPLLLEREILGSFLATGIFHYAGRGLATAYYCCNDAWWISEVISASGVHYVKKDDPIRCKKILLGLIEEAMINGIPQSQSAAPQTVVDLCVIGMSSSAGARFVSVRPDEIMAYGSLSGSDPPPLVRQLASPRDVLAYLNHSMSIE